MSQVGKIKEIWRYPVKSTRGEQLQSCAIAEKGLIGDRAWAVKDESVAEVRGGRHLPRLLHCSSRYTSEPTTEPFPSAMIRFPDGSEIASDVSDINTKLSEWMQQAVSVWPIQAEDNTEHYRRLPMTEEGLMEEFGREPGEPLPDLSKMPEILMKYVSVPGTYFDVTPVQLLTTASLKHLASINSDADWAVPRFRPNIVVDTGELVGLVESEWTGKTISFGDVELQCFAPSPRCAITMREQGSDIPKDPSILRTIVKHADQNLGVYCMVKKFGKIEVGDSVTVS
jgi:MOSC domain-containing protein